MAAESNAVNQSCVALIPRIVAFGYRNYVATSSKRTAVCKTCGSNVSEGPNTTSNFVQHLKTVHAERYKEYLESKTKAIDTRLITSFFPSQVGVYGASHPHQQAIREAIISDLIINCAMPLSMVENGSFRHFLSVLYNKYQPVSRGTVSSFISDMVHKQQELIRNQLEQNSWVSATVDIWSDRKMRGYLGVTAHTIEIMKSEISLKSYLLSCNRFTGSHTGEKISDAFESICDEYAIKNKLDYILSDNASNMKRAFTMCFPGDHSNTDNIGDDNDDDDLDDGSLWEELDEDAREDIDLAIARNCRKQRLQCFVHTLQLVVSDGLKETNAINLALSKAKKLSRLLHSSCSFKEAFENVFGKNKGIPALVCTRWNSTLQQISALLSLSDQTLRDLLEEQGHKELKFSPREWSQLQELVSILQPFLEATNLTQGENVITVSIVLPSILSLNHHLEGLSMSTNIRYLYGLIRTLKKSLRKRFQGIFVTVNMAKSGQAISGLPFCDPLYLMSAVLDPAFCMMWVEQDVLETEDVKEKVKKSVKDCIISEISQVSQASTVSEEGEVGNSAATASKEVQEEDSIPKKVPRLFAGYQRKKNNATDVPVSQFNRFLELCQEFDDNSPNASLNFWLVNKNNLSKMFPLAMRVLSVPASSAPVERVSSHRGIIMHPHRARLGSKILFDLIFLK